MTATVQTNEGSSSKYVSIKFIPEPGTARTSQKLDNPPSKVRPLWYVNVKGG